MVVWKTHIQIQHHSSNGDIGNRKLVANAKSVRWNMVREIRDAAINLAHLAIHPRLALLGDLTHGFKEI